MVKIKKTLSAKYHKPGQVIDINPKYIKHVLLQEEGELELNGVARRYMVCMIIDKTQTENDTEAKRDDETRKMAEGRGQVML